MQMSIDPYSCIIYALHGARTFRTHSSLACNLNWRTQEQEQSERYSCRLLLVRLLLVIGFMGLATKEWKC